jgi:uncharacterized sulfatase
MPRAAARTLSLTLLLWGGAIGAQPAARPNVVLFIGDDLTATDIGPYGNRVVRTPHLDTLARQSVRFTRAFAGSPTCTPSRGVMYTGLMPFRNGAHANHTPARPATRSIVQHLQPLGYRVALAGKLHIGPREVFPFEYVPESNRPEPGHEKDGVLYTDLDVGAVDRWLGALGADRPFALVVADHSPHVIWPERAEYAAARVDVPANHVDTPEYRASRARYYTDVSKMDRNVGLLLASLRRRGLLERTVFVFTADQGAQLPFAKWGLYDAGIQAPLLVRWPGVARGGRTSDALVSLADLLPTFLTAAGAEVPRDLDGRSLAPLLRGETATHHDAVFAAHTGDRDFNRAPMRMLRTARYKYIRNLAPDERYTTHMDRAKDHDGGREYWDSWVERSFREEHAAATLWRYHTRPAEELYDVQADPHETRNLAGRPEHARRLAELRQRLATWRAAQGDTVTGPEPREGDRPAPGGAPYLPPRP